MILLPRSIAEVRDSWGWVRNGLQTVIDKTGERWMPEDIYVALTSNNAALYAISDNGDDIGFVILKKNSDFDGPVIFVWVLWAEPGSLIGRQSAVFTELRNLGRAIGAKRVAFESPLNGWRWVKEAVPVRTVYEVEI